MAVLTPQVRDQLEWALSAYDLGALDAFSPVERGTVNTSYALTIAGTGYFFRLYEEQELEGARAEARLLAHLRKGGARTPAPVMRNDGELVGVHEGKAFAVFPFVRGDMRCQRAVTAADTAQLGAEIARLHVAARGAELRPSRFRVKDLEDRLAQIQKDAPPALAAHVDVLAPRLVASEAGRARTASGETLMIHGDLFRDNVLFDGDDIASVLDFESAGQGTRSYDLAVALLAFCFRERFDWVIARSLVSSYEAAYGLHSAPKEALYWDACFGTVRFTITRITDSAMRGGKKDFRRFLARQAELFALGPAGFAEALS